MKNFARLFLIALLMTSSAAKSESPISVNLKAGPTFPVGEYGAGPENAEAGLAVTGASFSLGMGYDLNSNYRLTLDFQYRTNPTDEQAIKDWAQSQYPTINWNIHTGAYKMEGVVVGFSSYFPERTKLILGMKVGIGVFNFSSPEFDISASSGEINSAMSQGSDKSVSGAFSLEAEVGYRFNKQHSISITPEYFVANPEFQSEDPITGENSSYNQSITTFGLNLLYAYHF
ncbi:MAG: hypothetical protein ACKO1U_07975 [Bacteroidota bacterium]